MTFAARMIQALRQRGNAICVGIDPRLENLPAGFRDRFEPGRTGRARAIEEFGKGVVDVVAPMVPVVKFQCAFYEAHGPEGVAALRNTARHAREAGLIVIIDGKRNDIGSTAEAYARGYLDRPEQEDRPGAAWDADALTINPYLGSDGIAPFVEAAARGGKGLFVLVRTSNPSAGEFQDLIADGRPIYRHVAERLAGWAAPGRDESGYGLVGAVVGATYPEQLAELRAALPGVFFLVPGYGSQGGTARDVAPAFDDQGLGAIINSSRGVTFAYERPAHRDRFGTNWQAAIEAAVREMARELAEHTASGRLRGESARS